MGSIGLRSRVALGWLMWDEVGVTRSDTGQVALPGLDLRFTSTKETSDEC